MIPRLPEEDEGEFYRLLPEGVYDGAPLLEPAIFTLKTTTLPRQARDKPTEKFPE